MKKTTYAILLFLIITLSTLSNASGQWQGSGTLADPYLIHNAEELKALSTFVMSDPSTSTSSSQKNSYNKHWKLMNDIQMDGISDFVPIGGWGSATGNSTTKFFAGKFHGNGKVIHNLKIYKPGKYYVGLFGITSSTSEIKNLGLDQIKCTGSYYVGGMVGYHNGTISHCFSKGEIEQRGTAMYNYFGGLIGYGNGSVISNCYARVSFLSSINSGGNFIGYSVNCTISNCYAVPNSINRIGNFSGYMASSCTLTNIYSLSFTTNPTASIINYLDENDFRDTSLVSWPGEENASLNYAQSAPQWKADTNRFINDGFPVLAWENLAQKFAITDSVYDISNRFVSVKGKFQSDSTQYLNKGFQYRPIDSVNWVSVSISDTLIGITELTCLLSDLLPYTDYQVRSYITDSSFTILGNIIPFKTLFWEGVGTSNSPYLISDGQDIVNLSIYVADQEYKKEKRTLKWVYSYNSVLFLMIYFYERATFFSLIIFRRLMRAYRILPSAVLMLTSVIAAISLKLTSS